MRYRRLGGLSVSELALGSYLTYGQTLDRDAGRACLRAALDAGINLFDTASSYGEAETAWGELFAELPRESFLVATKCRGLGRRNLTAEVDRSLGRLRVERIDLMQCHRFDPETPLAETVRAFAELIRQGKVRHWGLCRFDAAQTAETVAIARALDAPPPIGNQWHYNLLNRDIETGILAACRADGVGVLAYYPLAQGVLTGKYRGEAAAAGTRAANRELRETMWDYQAEKLARAERIAAVARSLDLSPAQLALAWCLRQPGVASLLTGATRPEQIRENAATAGVTLDGAALALIDEALA